MSNQPIQIKITGDEFGTFSYSFQFNGEKFHCFDFTSKEEAIAGAEFHIECLTQSLPHEISDGLGAIFRPEWEGQQIVCNRGRAA